MKKFILAMLMNVAVLAHANAQVTVPNTFSAGTTISSSAMNANFDALESEALNRTNGTITGNITVSAGITIDGIDISAYLSASGVSLLDSDSSHRLTIAATSDLTANRTLSLATGDSARTITLSGNPTLSDWFDQSVKAAASPSFAGVTITGGGSVVTSSVSSLTDIIYRVDSDNDGVNAWYFRNGAGSDVVTVTETGTITERARSAPMGEWIDISHNAANFTTNTGSWTVESGDQGQFAYMLIGKTMFINGKFATTTVSGNPNQLRVAVPGGFTAVDAGLGNGVHAWQDIGGGTKDVGFCHPGSGGTYVTLYRRDQSAYPDVSNNMWMQFTCIIEVQ